MDPPCSSAHMGNENDPKTLSNSIDFLKKSTIASTLKATRDLNQMIWY